MSLEILKQRMPDYAKDIKLNLSNIAGSTALTETQLWGAMLASALAARNPIVVEDIAAEAARHLSPAARNVAKAANAIMAMNNVRSEEHTYELQSLMRSQYAVSGLKKKTVHK